MAIIGIILYLAFIVLLLVSFWKLFTKMGNPGWASLIPFYNLYLIIKASQNPGWFIILFLIPLANIYALFKVFIDLAHKFGKSTGFGLGLIFLNFIFIPILAFSDAKYLGNNNQTSSPTLDL